MMDQYTLFVLLSPFAIFLSLFITIYCWHHRLAKAARQLSLAMGAVTFYVIANTLELVSPTEAATRFFASLCYPLIGLLSIGWFRFAIEYTNHEKWLRRYRLAIFFLIPILATLLVFTNSNHHLIWESISFVPVSHGFLYLKVNTYGPFFWIFWSQAYVLVLGGAALILRANFSPSWKYQMETRLALTGAILPIIVNAMYVLHLIPGFQKDFSPIGYAFSGVFFAISIFKFRIFDLAPLARTMLIDQMSDGMVTLDSTRRVVDCNPAAIRILAGENSLIMGEPAPLLTPFLDQLDQLDENAVLETEITFQHFSSQETYDLTIRQLGDRRSHSLGYLVALHDITELKNLLQITSQLAIQDPLTGILNRRYFNTLAGEEIERIQQSHSRCSIVMIDIDFFKNINDTLGHAAGDQVLQVFVRKLRNMLRSNDLLARVGGDEFILLLPETNQQTARTLSERLCKAIASEPLVTEDYGSIPISMSMGIAELSGDEVVSLEKIIQQADKNLYEAKKLGRNCVWVNCS